MGKLNCWEFQKCGREPGGDRVADLGVCSAALDDSTDGVNGGRNGGRVCWAITGTLCGGEPQGTFAHKITSCLIDCAFFKTVMQEENKSLELYPRRPRPNA